MSASIANTRRVARVVRGQPASDGAGVKLTRVIGQPDLDMLDPFLLLDEFRSDQAGDYLAGFPNHPHRGFETITYMITGRMRHRDSAGNEGLLQNGGVQWMTAASGVIHSELPEQENGAMEGFQLWLNLPAKDKMNDPWYKDFQSDDLPKYSTEDGVEVTVIAGQSHGIEGAVTRDITEPTYLDIHLPAGTSFSQAIPADHNAFAFVYRGTIEIAGETVPTKTMAILENNADTDGVTITADSSEDTKVILITGRPLREPIVQYGPFVMNSQQEIMQAVTDFQSGKFGEGA